MSPVRLAIGHRRIKRKSLIYTGIGSRQTPEPILRIITSIAQELAARDWLLRSGGSPGADAAFEKGCDLADGGKEIYLPWRGFNRSNSPLFNTPAEAMTFALRVHPHLRVRSWRVRKLRSRNVCQLLGQSLNEPSDLVIAWTEGGVPTGGSATVLQLAETRGIRVINLGAARIFRRGFRVHSRAYLPADKLKQSLNFFHSSSMLNLQQKLRLRVFAREVPRRNG